MKKAGEDKLNKFLNGSKVKAKIKKGNSSLHWLLYEDINQEWDSRDVIAYIIDNWNKSKKR